VVELNSYWKLKPALAPAQVRVPLQLEILSAALAKKNLDNLKLLQLVRRTLKHKNKYQRTRRSPRVILNAKLHLPILRLLPQVGLERWRR